MLKGFNLFSFIRKSLLFLTFDLEILFNYQKRMESIFSKQSPSNFHSSGPADSSPPADLEEAAKSWAGRARMGTDRSLKKLATPTISPEGIPQIRVSDDVFKRGAEAHKDYILGVFTGQVPFYSQIQSVLTLILGRGVKLQIHLTPAIRSMLVRIPNNFIRAKVVEQEIWHIRSSLFYVAQWTAQLAIKQPTFDFIPLWAHVRGVPFDLYTQEGLSLVASLIGFPVEADEFTIKMVSLEVAHLKVRANCTKKMPSVVEMIRDNGSTIQVSVDYSWLPPTCACCNQLGHSDSRCPNAKWAPTDPSKMGAASIPESSGTMPSSSEATPPLVGANPAETPSHSPVPSAAKSGSIRTSTEISSSDLSPELPSDQATIGALSNLAAVSPSLPIFVLAENASSALVPTKVLKYQNTSKKRKSSNLSRRGSPSPPTSVNPFACLAMELASEDPYVDPSFKPNLGSLVCDTLGSSASPSSAKDSGTGSDTPATGASLQDGKANL
ncbi:hypothetical protein Bca4012_018885 [Brassica carinata]